MITDESPMKMIKLIIEIPDEVFEIRNEIENGSPIANLVMIALKFAKPYEERPQGKWIKCGWSIRCSICNYDMPYAIRNFCPNCGADLREGDPA